MKRSRWLTVLLLVVFLCLPLAAYGAAPIATKPPVKDTIKPPVNVPKIDKIAEAPPYTLSGCVRDPSGNPLDYASITLSLAGGGSWSTSTGSGGRYSLDKLPAGNYTLTVGKPHLSDYIDQTFTFTMDRSMTKDVTLNFVTYTLSGRVLDAAGNGVGGAAVTIGSQSGTSGGDGSFAIGKIRGGYYPLAIAKTGYLNYSTTLNVRSDVSKYFTLMTASQTYTLSGYVRDPSGVGVVGAVVAVISIPLPGSASQKWHGVTGTGGSYSISGLPQVKVQAGVFESEKNYNPNYNSPGNNAQTFDIYGNMSRDFTITLSGTMTLRGTVRNAVSGAPLPDATVTVDGKSAITKPDGSYSVSGIRKFVQMGPSMTPQTLFTVTITHAGYNNLSKQVIMTGDTTSDFGLTPAGNP